MAFSGFHDREGKDIYEDDILRVYHSSSIALMTWVDEQFFLKWLRCEFPVELSVRSRTKVEDAVDSLLIIGNIYENPDLLNNLNVFYMDGVRFPFLELR